MFMMNYFRKKSLPILVAALDDSNEDVRFQAVNQLGCADGAKSAIPLLLRTLDDDSDSVRRHAGFVLFTLDPKQFPHLNPQAKE